MPTIKRLKDSQRPARKNETINSQDRIKIYQTAKWKRLRAIKIADSPFCEDCLKNGLVVSAQDVHHNVSFMSTLDPVQREFLAYDYDNLISLCKTCHQKRHNG